MRQPLESGNDDDQGSSLEEKESCNLKEWIAYIRQNNTKNGQNVREVSIGEWIKVTAMSLDSITRRSTSRVKPDSSIRRKTLKTGTDHKDSQESDMDKKKKKIIRSLEFDESGGAHL